MAPTGNGRLARLLANPNQGDWPNGYIKVESKRIVLGLPDDSEILPQFYHFARWVVERWPGTTLWFEDRQLPPENLMPGRDPQS